MRYVLRNSLMLCMCTAFLAACGEQRGGFQAKRFSEAEMRTYCMKPNADAKSCAQVARFHPGLIPNPNPQPPAPPAPTDSSKTQISQEQNGTMPQPVKTQPGPSVSPSQPAANPPAQGAQQNPNPANAPAKQGPTQGANSKVLVENSDQATLLKEDQELLKTPSADAGNLLRGLNAIIQGETGSLFLSIDAIVTIGSDVREVHVPGKPQDGLQAEPVPLRFSDSGKIDPLLIQVLNEKGESVSPGTLKVTAVCSDKECKSVFIRFTNGSVDAVVALQPRVGKDGTGSYLPVATNAKWDGLKQGEIVRSFDDALVDMKADLSALPGQSLKNQPKAGQKNSSVGGSSTVSKDAKKNPAPLGDKQGTSSGTAAIGDKQGTSSATSPIADKKGTSSAGSAALTAPEAPDKWPAGTIYEVNADGSWKLTIPGKAAVVYPASMKRPADGEFNANQGILTFEGDKIVKFVKNSASPAPLAAPQVTKGSSVLDLVPPTTTQPSRPSPLLPKKQVDINGGIVDVTATPASKADSAKAAVPSVVKAAMAASGSQATPAQQKTPDEMAKLIEQDAVVGP